MKVVSRFIRGAGQALVQGAAKRCLVLVLAFAPVSAQALDPLTLILLRMVRDKVITAGLESTYERASKPVPAPPAGSRLPMGLDDNQLRRLIDEGFVHLSSAQRQEVFQSMRAMLLDPRNVNMADAMVADLAVKASAVRQAHDALQKLTPERKRRIAREARTEYEKMPPENREDLAGAIRARLVPMPDDLTDMILAEFDQARTLSGTTPR
jgi:DNA-binding transcriptional regulator YdaS (Cro superfamily)